jgi:hypothetical protein
LSTEHPRGNDKSGATAGAAPGVDDRLDESLTDLFDRLDREAFRRALEQRDLRMLSSDPRRAALTPRRALAR